jgi:PPM family protein phosphatase
MIRTSAEVGPYVQYSFTPVRNGLIKKAVFSLDFAARVDRGLVHETNEDVARVVPRLALALVAGGMGGHDHGDVVSRTVADGVEQSFARFGGPGVNVDETAQRLKSAFREINQRMAEHPASGEGRAKIGTTLVAAVFAHGRVVIGNVGDSRCYRMRNRSLALLTQDHSFAEQLRQMVSTTTPGGKQAASEWGPILTRCLNGDEGVAVDIRIVRCEPGDVFLLCSDGLWGSVSGDVMAAILGAAQDASEACERLVGAAWAGGGLDNIGIAVVRLVPLQLRLDEPSWLEQPTRPSQQPGGDV